MSSFNDFLAERIWGGKDSSLDVDDCAESRRERFEPITPERLPSLPPPLRLNLWAAGRLAEWQALSISTSIKEAVCAAVAVKAVAQKIMSGGAPL